MTINGGTTELAHFIDQEDRFPVGDNPVDIELFLASYYEDVTGDGVEELIVCPNDRFASQSDEHIWVYQVSEGVNGLSFELMQKDFFVDQMVYPGPNTAPLFMDHNNDGLMDLVIGTAGRSIDGIMIAPALWLYENIGTENTPHFTLVNRDFLDMAQFSTTSAHFAPSIGDLDGDEDLDLVIGDNRGRLYYLENLSGSATSFNFAVPVYPAFDIKVSAWATPLIYDVDADGLGDLIIGEQNFNSNDGRRGGLNYFQNVGDIGSPVFDPDETASPNDFAFGNIFIRDPGFISNFSAPALVPLAGGEMGLAVGTARGQMNIYALDTPVVSIDTFDLMSSSYGGLREGEQSTYSFADLDSDGFLEVAMGSRQTLLLISIHRLFLFREKHSRLLLVSLQITS